jgi:hypothetical protein
MRGRPTGPLKRQRGRCVRGHENPPRYKGGGCVLCRKVYEAENYQRNREYKIAYANKRNLDNPESRRDYGRASRLGVPVAEVRAAIAACEGKCESCEIQLTHRKMCIDHDHNTGRIRGVLCVFCNALEGMLNKQKERTEKLLSYLVKANERELKRVAK